VVLTLAHSFQVQLLFSEPADPDPIYAALEEYALKKKALITLPCNRTAASPFEERVLSYIESIPMGTTVSYKEIARQLGNPKACRAVGNACRKNPLPLIVPCHRVIAS